MLSLIAAFILSGSGAPGITYPPKQVADEGTPLTFRPTLNFAGAGVSCADDTDKTTCTIAGGGGSSPLTTKGDLYTRDSSADARLPVGADNLCLVADSTQSTGIKWASCSAGGGLGAGEVQRRVSIGGP